MEQNNQNISANEEVNSNFITFFTKHKIEIPLIQRDYVQGSNLQSKKRNEFIDSLFEALKDDGKPCELDFIYGTENNGAFLPLDGQQRLTTQFLLHWYLINKCRLENPNEYKRIMAEIKWDACEFSYKTRRSSTVFTEKLRSYQPKKMNEAMSEDIKQQSWYSESWDLDPTVNAMMDMLDAIGNKYNGLKMHVAAQMLEKMLSSKIINFDKLDMGKFKLNDSLYVKMNARGKQLTEFENWKAKFIKFLEEVYADSEFDYIDENRNEFKTIKNYFTHSIEHEWTDLFWAYAVNDYKQRKFEYDVLPEEEKQKRPDVINPLIDDYFLNFYHYIFKLQYLISQKDSNDEEDKDIVIEDTEETRMDLFSKKDNINFLYQSLDTFVNITKNNNTSGNFFNKLFYLEGQQTDGRIRLFSSKTTNLFEACITSKASVDEQILLYCLIVYCIEKKCYTVTDELKIYMRVCRNLLESINQRLTNDMQIHSNVRFSQFPKYIATINDLCSITDYHNIEKLNAGMGDTETVTRIIGCYLDKDTYIYILEDSGYTHGSLYAFDLNINHRELAEALTAFKNENDINRARILVAYGYQGTNFGKCAHGESERRFFGYKDRWDVLFRYKSDSQALKDAFSSFVSDFSIQKDIESILNTKKNIINKDSFAYYFLNYDAFANSALKWTMDDQKDPKMVDAHHFFAINSSHDIISLPRFNSNPLLGYHTEPYACAVAHKIRNTHPEIYEKMDYTGKDKNKAKIVFNDYNIEMQCTDNGWAITFRSISHDSKMRRLSINMLRELAGKCKHHKKNIHYITIDTTSDYIESAYNFILWLFKK